MIDNTITDPTDPSDGRYLSAIGKYLVENYSTGTLDTETAPAGFNKVYKKEGQQCQFLIRQDAYVNSFKKLTFAVNGGDWFIIRNSWSYAYGPNSWKYFELVQTATNVWSIYSADAGKELVLKVSGIEGSKLKEIMCFGGEIATYFMTDVKAVRIDYGDQIIDNSAISANGATTTISTTLDAPRGFNTVNDFDTNVPDSGYLHGMYYSAAELVGYDHINFALKSTGYFMFNHGWSSNYISPGIWILFDLYQNDDLSWNLIATNLEGQTLYSENSLVAFKGTDSESYTNYSLNAILYGCPSSGFTSYKQDGVDLVVSVTEIRGTISKDKKGSIVDNSSVAPYQITGKIAPNGFEIASKGTNGYTDQGKYFLADIDISLYSEVWFMFKTENRKFCDSSWGNALAIGKWFKVVITKISDGNYESSVYDGSTLKFGYTNVDSFQHALKYYNYDGDKPACVWNSTEVRGTLAD